MLLVFLRCTTFAFDAGGNVAHLAIAYCLLLSQDLSDELITLHAQAQMLQVLHTLLSYQINRPFLFHRGSIGKYHAAHIHVHTTWLLFAFV
jgi:hypothetical protein